MRKTKALISFLCEQESSCSDILNTRCQKILAMHKDVSRILRQDDERTLSRCQKSIWEKVKRHSEDEVYSSSFLQKLRSFWELNPAFMIKSAAITFLLVMGVGLIFQTSSAKSIASSDMILESEDMSSLVIPASFDELFIRLPESQEFTVIGTPVYIVE